MQVASQRTQKLFGFNWIGMDPIDVHKKLVLQEHHVMLEKQKMKYHHRGVAPQRTQKLY